MASTNLQSSEQSGDKALKELRRSLAKALAYEEEVIRKINQLEKNIISTQFNDLQSQRPSQMQQKATEKFHEVQNTRKTTFGLDFVEHIGTDIADLDALLSGVVFTAEIVHGYPDGIQYILKLKAGKVIFFLRFHWLEELNYVKNTQVVLPLPFHKAELGPILRLLERNNNVHKIVRIVTNYSKVIDEREEMLQELEGNYAPFFKYYENSEKEGFKFEISDNSTGKKYFFSTWTVVHYKTENNMDHCFNVHVDEGAEALATTQKEIFLKLTADASHRDISFNITKLIGILVQGFLKWLPATAAQS